MKTTMLILAMIAFLAIGLPGSAQEEKIPEYPGGNMALVNDINSIVKYPKEALDKGITGKVYITFDVNPKGKIENVCAATGVQDINGKVTLAYDFNWNMKIENSRIASGVDSLLYREGYRVINQLNKTWMQTINVGKTVNLSMTVLFDFKEDKTIDVSLVNPS